MSLTLRHLPGSGDPEQYEVAHEGRHVGRVYLSNPNSRTGYNWFWGINCGLSVLQRRLTFGDGTALHIPGKALGSRSEECGDASDAGKGTKAAGRAAAHQSRPGEGSGHSAA